MKFFCSLTLKNYRNHLSWKLSWMPSQNVFLNDAWTSLFQWTLLATTRFTIVHCRLWNMDHPSLIMVHWSNLHWNRCIQLFRERLSEKCMRQSRRVLLVVLSLRQLQSPGTVYWSYPILPFGIVACTFFSTTFLEITVYNNYSLKWRRHLNE